MLAHEQVFAKVNAEVDRDIRPLIEALSCVDGLVTQASCQGELGNYDGYVYFSLGSWQECSAFIFETLLPEMSAELRSCVKVSVLAYDTDYCTGCIIFDPAALPGLTAAVAGLQRRVP